MKIIVDAFGGDNAPKEILSGAIDALRAKDGFTVVFTGDKEKIDALLAVCDYPKERVEIIDAKEIITNDDIPTDAIRRKKNSSIVVGFDALSNDTEAKAMVSAGSTGAVLTGAVLLLRRIDKINRPALSPILPTVNGGKVVLIDCGATPDAKAVNLLQNALMGKAYAEAMLGIKNPRIGLLSNGTEDKKGNELNKEAFPLLKECKNLSFVGNMEAREILSGDYDVVVADGFSGNIALKASEGAALSLFELLKDGIMKGGLRAKLGFLLLKPVFKKVKNVMDYNNNGGAVLLGLTKIVVKSHGSSKAKSICASVLQAYELSSTDIISRIEDGVKA